MTTARKTKPASRKNRPHPDFWWNAWQTFVWIKCQREVGPKQEDADPFPPAPQWHGGPLDPPDLHHARSTCVSEVAKWLKEACGEGRVTARAVPALETMVADPEAAPELLDAAFFQRQAVELTEYGWIRTPEKFEPAKMPIRYVNSHFRASEVRRAWPDMPKLAAAKEWMLWNVSMKRESTISACREAVGRTYAVALEAWKTLPAERRGTPGRPKSLTCK